MKINKPNAILAMAIATIFTTTVNAEAEVTGLLTHESAKLIDGDKSVLKTESKAKIFIDGDLDEILDGSTYHVEIQATIDKNNAIGSGKSYTQNDILREAYIDFEAQGWAIRAGKQQVVWGTADGMKLLDMINPTDYTEMSQNQMEDSRIPVWMVNAERDLESGATFQVIMSQPKENIFAGLNRGTDTSVRSNNPDGSDRVYAGTDEGSPFLMKGPDTITGGQNGFLNIAPDLGSIASGFANAFNPLGVEGSLAGLGNPDMNDLLSAFTVGAFTSGASLEDLSDQFVNMQLGKGTYYWMAGTDGVLGTLDDPDMTDPANQTALADFQATMPTMGFRDLNFAGAIAQMACAGGPDSMGLGTCAADGSTTQTDFDLAAGGIDGSTVLNGWAQGYATNLSSFGDGKQDSAFEFMTNTGFRTFDTFANARSQYVYSMPSDTDKNMAFKFRNSTESGLNYTLNYSYNYDTNPIIDLSWRNDAGEVLEQNTVAATLNMMTPTGVETVDGTYIELTDKLGNVYGGKTATDVGQAAYGAVIAASVDPANPTADELGAAQLAMMGAMQSRSAILTFDQSVQRVHNIGGSFDMGIDTKALGAVVIRGEALYTKDGYSPVMDKAALSVGDLTGSLQMKKADRVKFVLGADITAMTNMMISAQIIQDTNLDFVDNGEEYTTDYATMHLTNGFKKGTKHKNYYSLFFSKPFGESGQHRWNNITMYEEGNGNWNRFDIDYSIDDDTQATFEVNKYWGDENTQFGQLKNASNVQIGIKYSF